MSDTTQATQDKAVLREVVGVFFDGDSLEKAIDQLKASGYTDNCLGLMAHSSTVSEKLGHLYDQVDWDSDSDSTPETRFVEKQSAKSSANAFLGGLGIIASAAASGAVVASAAIVAGPVGAATAGAAVVGGIGALASTIISESDSQQLQNWLEEGHMLLFVRPNDSKQEEETREIIAEFSGVDTKVVELRKAA
jgi:hypothetical protein